MAPRTLMVRWRKDKMRRKKQSQKAFATKAASTFYKHVKKTEAVFQADNRVAGKFEAQMARLEHYIKRHKPHHTILYSLFKPAIEQVARKVFPEEIIKPQEVWKRGIKIHRNGYIEETLEDVTPSTFEAGIHPFIAVEQLLDLYKQQDESLAVFQWDVVLLGHSDHHDIWMYFRGQECFVVYRRGQEVFQSIRYKNPMWLKAFAYRSVNKLEWAGEPMTLESNSSEDA